MKTAQERFNLSDETYRSMKQFFLKTSIPRILAQREEEKKELAKLAETESND